MFLAKEKSTCNNIFYVYSSNASFALIHEHQIIDDLAYILTK